MVFGIRAPETSDPNMGKVYYMTDNTQFNKPSQKVSIFKNPNYGNYNRDYNYRCGNYPPNNNYNQPNSQVNNKLLQIVAMLISILQDMMGANKPQPPVKPKPQPPVNDDPVMVPLYAGPDINPPNYNIKPSPMPHIDDNPGYMPLYAGPDLLPTNNTEPFPIPDIYDDRLYLPEFTPIDKNITDHTGRVYNAQ